MTEADRNATVIRLLPALRRAAQRRFGTLARALGRDLDDLVSEGALAALRALGRWDPAGGSPPELWAMRRAIGAMKDWLRDDTGYRRTRLSPVPIASLDTLADPAPSAEDRHLAAARVTALHRAIAQIDHPRTRDVLNAIAAGHSQRRAAALCGYSESRVSQIVRNQTPFLRQKAA